MDYQRIAHTDPYLAGSIAARGHDVWGETRAEQEADALGLEDRRRRSFMQGWRDELAQHEKEREKERQAQMFQEYDEMGKDYTKGDPAR